MQWILHSRRSSILACAVFVGLTISCASANPPATDGGVAATPARSGPFVLEAPARRSGGALRVLVYHDMEGLSGQNDPHTFSFRYPNAYKKGRELLVADVNAVVAGLVAGGATAVHVVDAHGSGNPEPDIETSALDPRATQVFRDKPFRQYVDLVEPNVYDAIVVVGMHAKTGSKGFASHTYTLGIEFIVNGMAITETELIAFSWGRVGVPVILASGDQRLREDLRTMPWIEFVTVKTATSASTADLRPVPEVHAEMRAKAKTAVEQLSRMRSMRVATPVRAAVRVVPPASLAFLQGVPGLTVTGDRVDFTAADFGATYDGLVALTGVATRAYPSVLMEVVRARADGAKTMLDYGDALTMRWLDVESGRWTPPAPAPVPAGRRYFGAR